MKIYRLKKDYKHLFKKGAMFFLVSHSEFIGVKEFVLQSQDLKVKLNLNEEELESYFFESKEFIYTGE